MLNQKIRPGDIIYSKRHKQPLVVERVREAGFICRNEGVKESNERRKEMIVYPEDVEGIRQSFDSWAHGSSACRL